MKALDLVLEETSGSATQTGRDALEIQKFGTVDANGLVSLHWSGLRPGTYQLNALVRGTTTVLATMPNLAVSSRRGKAPSVLDLNGALYPFHLEIVGPDGTPLGHAKASLHWKDGSDRAAMGLRGASSHGIAPNVPVEVRARAEGYASVRQELRTGSQRLVMQPVKLAPTQIQVTGLDLPDGVQAELAWGPASLTRAVQQPSCFEASVDLERATGELRVGRQLLGSDSSLTVQQPAHPATTGGLRVMLVLSAPPVEDRPGLPTKVLLDEISGWVLPNPQAAAVTLNVDAAALGAALSTMGRPR